MTTETAALPVYSAREQTAGQRQYLIDMGRSWQEAQGATPGPVAEAVYARYVAGELTLTQVTDELVRYYAQQREAREQLGKEVAK